ncbi:hypothetical protein A2U01_0085750, partial [Trifolium medium]|nr:hypothetical protein [Trifolium medium]
MICSLGMSTNLPPFNMKDWGACSQSLLKLIDKEMLSLLQEAQSCAQRLVEDNIDE